MSKLAYLFTSGLVLTLFVAVVSSVPAAAYTKDQINAAIGSWDFSTDTAVSGYEKAKALDVGCRDRYLEVKAGGSNFRQTVNSSAYASYNWLSASGAPASMSITVPASSTNKVNLQLNRVDMICAIGKAPELSSFPSSSVYNSRMIGYNNTLNDGAITTWTSGEKNRVNMTAYGYQLDAISVASGGGSVSGVDKGDQLFGTRQSSSTRFWFSPKSQFSYTPPKGGFTRDTDVTLTATVRPMKRYYLAESGYRWGYQVTCSVPNANGKEAFNYHYYGTDPKAWKISGSGPSFSKGYFGSSYNGGCGQTTISMKIHFKVDRNYTLTPSIDTLPRTVVTGPAATTITGKISNAGPTESDANIPWRLFQAVYAPGVTPNVSSYDGSTVCDTPRTASADACTVIATGTTGSSAIDASKAYSAAKANAVAQDWEVGTRVCFGLSVSPYGSAASQSGWRHSALRCMVVGVYPRVQVLGGDLITGRSYGSLASNPAANVVTNESIGFPVGSSPALTYGSWSEYAILPSGTILGMGSGSYFANGASNYTQCAASLLSFTNAQSNGVCNDTDAIGRYAVSGSVPSIGSRFPVKSAASISGASVDLDDLQGGRSYTTDEANLVVSAGRPLEKGKWLVIHAPESTVTIAGNLIYSNARIASARDIPQLVIIARTIKVAGNVDRVDSWLSATNISTCADVTSAKDLSSGVCNRRLEVNGPVSAGYLHLWRTYVDRNNQTRSAEVFNLRADAYLWSAEMFRSYTTIRTVEVKDLPPRF